LGGGRGQFTQQLGCGFRSLKGVRSRAEESKNGDSIGEETKETWRSAGVKVAQKGPILTCKTIGGSLESAVLRRSSKGKLKGAQGGGKRPGGWGIRTENGGGPGPRERRGTGPGNWDSIKWGKPMSLMLVQSFKWGL